MTSYLITKLDFSKESVAAWDLEDKRHSNWPVVYILDNRQGKGQGPSSRVGNIYVGESLNAVSRLRQHLETPEKQHLKNVSVVIDEKFNKSVCLDLESYLIRLLAGDGAYRVLNRNSGIVESNYYLREQYRKLFRKILKRLEKDGVFTKTVAEIENSDLFKLSPYKSLTEDQAISVECILKGLLNNLVKGSKSTVVIQGDPGTGKTVVAIYTIKLIMDIKSLISLEDLDGDSRFSGLFTEKNQRLLEGIRIGLVVPQQSLRDTIKRVFKKTLGLEESMVMTPFEVGEAQGTFDLILVDETHRLNQRANQPSGVLNAKFSAITKNLFGDDGIWKNQLDWIRMKSRHQILFLDTAQSVRPADLPLGVLEELVREARLSHSYFKLQTQMRVQAGSKYVSYIRQILNPDAPNPSIALDFGNYDLRMFSDLPEMRDEIFRRDAEVGLSRIVAGYAWEWKTKRDKTAFDIEIGQTQLRWNTVSTDWIASSGSLQEVGSIHTVQGYDLNYVGVIIGPDLRYNIQEQRFWISRESYFDKKGKENNPVLGIKYSDNDLLRFITQIYAVLMTRGMLGTYIYSCDPGVREHLKSFIPMHSK